MGSFSLWHWIVVLLIVVLVFGAGRLPKAMGDIAKGVNAFRKGLKEPEDEPARPSDQVAADAKRAETPKV